MTTQSLIWPTKADYDLAIKNWQQTVLDPTVSAGTLSQDKMGIHRFGGANLYVAVYKIGNWMIRCFCSNPPRQPPRDIIERYEAISDFCKQHKNDVSALLPTTFVKEGIKVHTQIFPIIKMPFLSHCPSLGDFIADHYQKSATMEALSKAWLRMIREMEAASIAHGDLDLTNVLVEQQHTGLVLRLIDYDNVWIPALAGYPQTEHGHSPFQHPHFLPPNQRPYDTLMDRFSALVIYISLRALTTNPELYDEWGADESERLLFSENDYKTANLVDGRIAQLLTKVTDIELRSYIQALAQSLRNNYMPPALDDIAQMTTHIAPQSARLVQARPPRLQPPSVALWEQRVYTVGQSPWNYVAPEMQGFTTQRGPDDPASMYGWATSSGSLPPHSPLYGSTSSSPLSNGAVQQSGGTVPTSGIWQPTNTTADHKPSQAKRRVIITIIGIIIALIVMLLLFFFVLKPLGIVP